MTKPYPFVSVIIPVRNNYSGLQLCVKALERQSYPSNFLEVLCIDDGSEQQIELSSGLSLNVSVFRQAQKGSYAARNLGIKQAKGEILAFTDSDCIPEVSWMEEGVKALLALCAERSGIIGGQIEFTFERPKRPTVAELYDSTTFMQQAVLVNKHQFSVTANLFAKRSLFDEVGFFDERLQSGGDGEWGKRVYGAGYAINYAQHAIVKHPARNTIEAIRTKWLRVINGFEDIRQFNGNAASYRYSQAKFWLIPPIQKSFRKVMSDGRLETLSKKIKVFAMCIYVHYVCQFELFRRRQEH